MDDKKKEVKEIEEEARDEAIIEEETAAVEMADEEPAPAPQPITAPRRRPCCANC